MPKQSSSRLENVLKCKCPKCHSGYMFKEKNAYRLKKLFALKDACDVCNLPFCPEPRYYDGAMFVSYGFSVAIVITAFTLFNFFLENANLNVMIGSTIGLAVIVSPLSFRISRSVWIHFFFSFDPDRLKNH